MLILQDFEAITPNLLARTIETVEGGGIVVCLLQGMKSLRDLYGMTMVRREILLFIIRLPALLKGSIYCLGRPLSIPVVCRCRHRSRRPIQRTFPPLSWFQPFLSRCRRRTQRPPDLSWQRYRSYRPWSWSRSSEIIWKRQTKGIGRRSRIEGIEGISQRYERDWRSGRGSEDARSSQIHSHFHRRHYFEIPLSNRLTHRRTWTR